MVKINKILIFKYTEDIVGLAIHFCSPTTTTTESTAGAVVGAITRNGPAAAATVGVAAVVAMPSFPMVR